MSATFPGLELTAAAQLLTMDLVRAQPSAGTVP
jgi:hypothetical protein